MLQVVGKSNAALRATEDKLSCTPIMSNQCSCLLKAVYLKYKQSSRVCAVGTDV